MYIISILMILDYILTYIGINKGIISEANPLMVCFFSYPFSIGIFIRIFMVILLLVPFYILKYKHFKLYLRYASIACFLYVPVFILHIRWIIELWCNGL